MNTLDKIKDLKNKFKSKKLRIVLLVILLLLAIIVGNNFIQLTQEASRKSSNSYDSLDSSGNFEAGLVGNSAGGIEVDSSASINASTNTSNSVVLPPVEPIEPDGIATDDSQNQKIVYTTNIGLEVLDWDKSEKALDSLLKEFNAVTFTDSIRDNTPEYEYWSTDSKENIQSYKYRNLTVGIPEQNLDEFNSRVKELGHVTMFNKQSSDITSSYNKNDESIKSYENQLNRLNELYDKAETIQDIISIEDRIAQVSIDLQFAKNEKQRMDSLVSLSRVNITIDTVRTYSLDEEVPFGIRLIEKFKESALTFIEQLENIVLALISMMWWIIVVCSVVVVLKVIHKKKKKINLGVVNAHEKKDLDK